MRRSCGRPLRPERRAGRARRAAAVMTPQGFHLVDLRGQNLADLGQSQAQCPQNEDLLQSQQLAFLVVAVAVGPDPGRRQQTDLVVVPQRPSRHPRHPGDFRSRPGHRHPRVLLDRAGLSSPVHNGRSFPCGSFKPRPRIPAHRRHREAVRPEPGRDAPGPGAGRRARRQFIAFGRSLQPRCGQVPGRLPTSLAVRLRRVLVHHLLLRPAYVRRPADLSRLPGRGDPPAPQHSQRTRTQQASSRSWPCPGRRRFRTRVPSRMRRSTNAAPCRT